jgi:hypothetical protein
MDDTYTPEPWLTGIIAKRPETVLLLHAMIIAGLRKGRVSAEDAHNIPVTHPNTRGAAMKLLGKCGFKKDYPFQGTTAASHGHWMFMWTLYDAQKAKAILGRLRGTAVELGKEPGPQLEMAI